MKTSGATKSLRIFPLIVVLMLSGCGGEGSGQLAESECKALETLISDYQDLSKELEYPKQVLIKMGMSLEQYSSGGCDRFPKSKIKKLSDAECKALEGFIEKYRENVDIAVEGGLDPTYSSEKLFEYSDKYDNGC